MSQEEFAVLRRTTIREYAAEQVLAGIASPDRAAELATSQMDDLLPDGVDTPDMRLMTAEIFDHQVVGHVWIGLRRPASPVGSAWLYGIEVVASERGQGYGRALLLAAEEEARSHGATAMGLNVFWTNSVARHLYSDAGYQVTAQQMQKAL